MLCKTAVLIMVIEGQGLFGIEIGQRVWAQSDTDKEGLPAKIGSWKK